MSSPRYARVAVNRPLRRTFDYEIPPALAGAVAPGCRVVVPFGTKDVTGIVVELADQAQVGRTKLIKRLVDPRPVLSDEMLRLGAWMADEYCCGIGEALSAMLPGGAKARPKTQRVAGLAVDAQEARAIASSLKRAPKQRAALLALAERSPIPTSQLAERDGIPSATLAALAKKGLVRIENVEVRRAPRVDMIHHTPEPERLTQAQEEALRAIRSALDARRFGVFLLHGVTASGKTEVYLQAIAHLLRRGRDAICLVPEISLTPQTVDRFAHRFPGKVALRHSKLSAGEAHDEWERIRRGEAKVVVGARSALFAPVADLGLIVIDEEHETSYKQDDPPRYHAREVALQRARSAGAVVILGTATPSIESYAKTLDGTFTRLTLPERIDGRPHPRVEVVDMRRQWREGRVRSVLSERLQDAIDDVLRRGGQAMLLLNRRGFATFVHCPHCGFVAECENCRVSLTYHRGKGLRCHYCGLRAELPKSCPECGSGTMHYGGSGAQKIEEELGKLFPTARVRRMDSDAMTRRHAFEDALAAFRNRETDILVGTQMIAKGLDFPDVALVGIVSADTALFLPDFRAAERTFQLITQMAGRAGRGETPGLVIIQTYDPEHYAIRAAAELDYEGFAKQELEYRRRAMYPPLARMALVTLRGKDPRRVEAAADRLKEALSPAFADDVRMLGPGPAPLAMLRGQHRWQLTLLSQNVSRLRSCCQLIPDVARGKGWSGLTVSVDVDPISTL